MITSPINPYRYWKLEEIQSILNQIEGYENVVIEFQYQQSDNWTTKWDCTYGIKEQLVNGQYNWLLKYMFVFDATSELDARNTAWQEAAERLVTDVWKNSIHSFRKQQRDLNNFKFKKPPLTEEQTKKFISNIETMTETNKTNKLKPWLRQTLYWIRAALVLSVMLGVCWFIAEHKIALDIFVWTLGLGLIGGLVYCFKTLMGLVFKDDGFEN
jgi:sensor c-di-GMP phosphodiesterase-like protein